MAKFVNTVRAIGDNGPMNLEEVVTFEKFDDNGISVARGRHQIVFIRHENAVGRKNLFWKYKCECDRDADFSSLVSINSVTL